MRIITLRGDSNRGKTTTINIVYNDVLDIKNGGISTNKQQEGNEKDDFSDIVLFKGQRIAFFSTGDSYGITKTAVEKFNSLKVDILVIVINNKFVKSLRMIQKFANNIIDKNVVHTKLAADELISNSADAKLIFTLI